MHGFYATVEPHSAEQAIGVPVRRFAGLPCFSKDLHPRLLQEKHLDRHATTLPNRRTSHFLGSARGCVQIQDSPQRNYSAAFLSIPSLATKLLQMELIHLIQTDKYED
jgi:hypothetical protein